MSVSFSQPSSGSSLTHNMAGGSSKSWSSTPKPQRTTDKTDTSFVTKWLSRAVVLSLVFAACSWLDTIKVCGVLGINTTVIEALGD